ncbi:unnamed protein product [Onchocerca ochengi]|uniref:NR LBD domain-containing protein n=1 Tax=Onchocerca ochengi TaxID=42157 RepID=A0A182E9A4_ONCOC|nr:unnamed protein product [Onchocerca ochengi]
MEITGNDGKTKEQLAKEWNRFRVLYDNGHLPVRLEQRGTGKPSRNIRWLENPKLITAERFMDLLIKFSCVLPLLEYPYRLIAEQGVIDLLKNYVNNESVIQCLPQLVRPPEITKKTMALSLIIQLAQIPQCCPALIPYFRHLFLPLQYYMMLSENKVYDIEYK